MPRNSLCTGVLHKRAILRRRRCRGTVRGVCAFARRRPLTRVHTRTRRGVRYNVPCWTRRGPSACTSVERTTRTFLWRPERRTLTGDARTHRRQIGKRRVHRIRVGCARRYYITARAAANDTCTCRVRLFVVRAEWVTFVFVNDRSLVRRTTMYRAKCFNPSQCARSRFRPYGNPRPECRRSVRRFDRATCYVLAGGHWFFFLLRFFLLNTRRS